MLASELLEVHSPFDFLSVASSVVLYTMQLSVAVVHRRTLSGYRRIRPGHSTFTACARILVPTSQSLGNSLEAALTLSPTIAAASYTPPQSPTVTAPSLRKTNKTRASRSA